MSITCGSKSGYTISPTDFGVFAEVALDPNPPPLFGGELFFFLPEAACIATSAADALEGNDEMKAFDGHAFLASPGCIRAVSSIERVFFVLIVIASMKSVDRGTILMVMIPDAGLS